MRLSLYSVIALFAAGCQFDPAGAPGGQIEPPTVDAALPSDAASLDALAPIDSAVPDAISEPDAPPAVACLSNPAYVARPNSDHRYRLRPEITFWTDARERCENDGAHMVVIDDQDENDHVHDLSGSTKLWIGLSDRDDEGTFVWVTGVPFAFVNWQSGEPNDGSAFSTEDCGQMLENGKWNDEGCGEPFPYVCECDPGHLPLQ